MATDKKEILKKLKDDLKNKPKLMDEWVKDPAAVFVKYGLANKREDVKVAKATGSGALQRIKCGCGCILSVELELEN